MTELLVPTMILFCKAIKFGIEEIVLREICVKICKKSEKLAKNWSEKNAEKGKMSGKRQEKMKAN